VTLPVSVYTNTYENQAPCRLDMIDTSWHEGLRNVPGFSLPVLSSAGLESRAGSIAERVVKAHRFLSKTLEFEPPSALLVLSIADWPSRSGTQVYGMPHFRAGNLIVAGQPADFWQGFVSMIREESADSLKRAEEVYRGPNGSIDFSPFFDMLAVHELGHIFHDQVPFRFPRAWLTEFFANLCLHAYIASIEPENLPVLETFPQIVARTPPDRFPARTLTAFEAFYPSIEPRNYGWYQCRLHVAAKHVYDIGGILILQKLWKTFLVGDGQLSNLLKRKVHTKIAEVASTWPK